MSPKRHSQAILATPSSASSIDGAFPASHLLRKDRSQDTAATSITWASRATMGKQQLQSPYGSPRADRRLPSSSTVEPILKSPVIDEIHITDSRMRSNPHRSFVASLSLQPIQPDAAVDDAIHPTRPTTKINSPLFGPNSVFSKPMIEAESQWQPYTHPMIPHSMTRTTSANLVNGTPSPQLPSITTRAKSMNDSSNRRPRSASYSDLRSAAREVLRQSMLSNNNSGIGAGAGAAVHYDITPTTCAPYVLTHPKLISRATSKLIRHTNSILSMRSITSPNSPVTPVTPSTPASVQPRRRVRREDQDYLSFDSDSDVSADEYIRRVEDSQIERELWFRGIQTTPAFRAGYLAAQRSASQDDVAAKRILTRPQLAPLVSKKHPDSPPMPNSFTMFQSASSRSHKTTTAPDSRPRANSTPSWLQWRTKSTPMSKAASVEEILPPLPEKSQSQRAYLNALLKGNRQAVLNLTANQRASIVSFTPSGQHIIGYGRAVAGDDDFHDLHASHSNNDIRRTKRGETYRIPNRPPPVPPKDFPPTPPAITGGWTAPALALSASAPNLLYGQPDGSFLAAHQSETLQTNASDSCNDNENYDSVGALPLLVGTKSKSKETKDPISDLESGQIISMPKSLETELERTDISPLLPQTASNRNTLNSMYSQSSDSTSLALNSQQDTKDTGRTTISSADSITAFQPPSTRSESSDRQGNQDIIRVGSVRQHRRPDLMTSPLHRGSFLPEFGGESDNDSDADSESDPHRDSMVTPNSFLNFDDDTPRLEEHPDTQTSYMDGDDSSSTQDVTTVAAFPVTEDEADSTYQVSRVHSLSEQTVDGDRLSIPSIVNAERNSLDVPDQDSSATRSSTSSLGVDRFPPPPSAVTIEKAGDQTPTHLSPLLIPTDSVTSLHTNYTNARENLPQGASASQVDLESSDSHDAYQTPAEDLGNQTDSSYYSAFPSYKRSVSAQSHRSDVTMIDEEARRTQASAWRDELLQRKQDHTDSDEELDDSRAAHNSSQLLSTAGIQRFQRRQGPATSSA